MMAEFSELMRPASPRYSTTIPLSSPRYFPRLYFQCSSSKIPKPTPSIPSTHLSNSRASFHLPASPHLPFTSASSLPFYISSLHPHLLFSYPTHPYSSNSSYPHLLLTSFVSPSPPSTPSISNSSPLLPPAFPIRHSRHVRANKNQPSLLLARIP